MGLVAPRPGGSSQTRDRTHVPCIGRRMILHHWTTRAVPKWELWLTYFPPAGDVCWLCLSFSSLPRVTKWRHLVSRAPHILSSFRSRSPEGSALGDRNPDHCLCAAKLLSRTDESRHCLPPRVVLSGNKEGSQEPHGCTYILL